VGLVVGVSGKDNVNEITTLDEKILDKAKFHDWSTPEFKLKYFVSKSHIHPLHQLKQYMLELNSKQDMVEVYEKEIKTFEIQIEIEEEKKILVTYKAEVKLCEIEILDLKRKILSSKEKLKTVVRERDKILKLIKEFNDSPQGKDKHGNLYIEKIDDADYFEENEREYWEYRLAKQTAMDMIAYGRIGVGNLDAITQLEAETQNKIIAMAYEILITNEARMNKIQDLVSKKLEAGEKVSGITQLMNIKKTEFINQLEFRNQNNVHLIQSG